MCVSFPEQLPGLIKCLFFFLPRQEERDLFWTQEGRTHCSEAFQTKGPQAGPRAGDIWPDPVSPAPAFANTGPRPAVTCCRHLSGTGAGRGAPWEEPRPPAHVLSTPRVCARPAHAQPLPPCTELRGAVTAPTSQVKKWGTDGCQLPEATGAVRGRPGLEPRPAGSRARAPHPSVLWPLPGVENRKPPSLSSPSSSPVPTP